jgi:hypothetical protein
MSTISPEAVDVATSAASIRWTSSGTGLPSACRAWASNFPIHTRTSS